MKSNRSWVFVVLVTMLSWVGGSHSAQAEKWPDDAQLEQLLEPSWRAIGGPASGWFMRISSPLPAAWPPDGSGLVYRYAYAFQWGLRDAERQAKPWARILLDVTGEKKPKVEMLAKSLTESGVQAVMPVPKEKSDAVLSAQKAIRDWVLRKGVPGDDARQDRKSLRKGYNWSAVLTKELRRYHAGFFAWIDGDKL